jgi:hypothetical protein
MIPIVASLLGTLAQNGLGLLSSAIQAKGKEVVENTFGVKFLTHPHLKMLASCASFNTNMKKACLNWALKKPRWN